MLYLYGIPLLGDLAPAAPSVVRILRGEGGSPEMLANASQKQAASDARAQRLFLQAAARPTHRKHQLVPV